MVKTSQLDLGANFPLVFFGCGKEQHATQFPKVFLFVLKGGGEIPQEYFHMLLNSREFWILVYAQIGEFLEGWLAVADSFKTVPSKQLAVARGFVGPKYAKYLEYVVDSRCVHIAEDGRTVIVPVRCPMEAAEVFEQQGPLAVADAFYRLARKCAYSTPLEEAA